MKKLTIILNAVLFAAVVVLYVLYFVKPKAAEQNSSSLSLKTSDSLNYSIAFVEFDSILANYDMFIDLQRELLDKQGKSEAELNSKSKAWEKGAADYQDKASKGLITRSKAMEIEGELYQQQQNLLKLRDDMTLELAEEKQVMDRQVMYSILEFLEEFNKEYNYQYIFSKSFGGNLIFAESGLDITDEVLSGLNKKYHEDTEK